jgi:hypothetical protein
MRIVFGICILLLAYAGFWITWEVAAALLFIYGLVEALLGKTTDE